MTVVADGFFGHTDHESKCTVIPNGYDVDDLRFVQDDRRNKKFTIGYAGSIKQSMGGLAFFRILEAVSDDKSIYQRMRVEIMGQVDPVMHGLIEKMNIKVEINWHGYTDHDEVIQRLSRADLLLMFISKSKIAKSILTGKLVEYLLMKRPIVAFGPLGGAADSVLKTTQAGRMFDFDDEKNAGRFILQRYKSWKHGKDDFTPDEDVVRQFDRRLLTEKLAKILQGGENGRN
jgi:glycosyltransferase involved in cell wall biosynthesis